MDRLEDRIRTSLGDRAADVRPTPHLYRQVRGRIDGRRRRRAWVWAPAGAAVAAAVAVPLLLQSGPQVPTIEDLADRPGASATGATQLITVDGDGTVGTLDLPTGTFDAVGGAAGDGAGSAPRVWVAPDRREFPPPTVVVDTFRSTGTTGEVEPGRAPGGPSAGGAADVGELRAVAHVDGQRLLLPTDPAPGLRAVPQGAAVLSPDGGWLATLVEGGDRGDDAWALQLTSVPHDPEEGMFESFELVQPLPAGSTLQSWTSAGWDDDEVRLAFRDRDGAVHQLAFRVGADGVPTTDPDVSASRVVDGPVDAYADDHLGGYVTLADGVLAHVQPVADGEVRTEVDVAAVTEGASRVGLRAFGTTTVLTTDAAAWVLERGPDGWTEPERLEHGAVDAAPVGRDLPTPEEPQDEGAADPDGPGVADGDAPDEAGDVGGDGETAPFGDGLVVADDTTVSLVAPDGTLRELYTFPAEGESTIVDVAVRPGSTLDDVTVALTTRAEGMFDVRWLRGVADEWEVVASLIEAGPFPLAVADLGVPPTVAWSPEGELLAVVAQLSPEGPVELRTLGWTDAGPIDDPNFGASFTLDTDRTWSAIDWVWTGGADGEMARSGHLVLLDPTGGASARLAIERQGDGAVALAADAAPEVQGDDVAGDLVGVRSPSAVRQLEVDLGQKVVTADALR